MARAGSSSSNELACQLGLGCRFKGVYASINPIRSPGVVAEIYQRFEYSIGE